MKYRVYHYYGPSHRDDGTPMYLYNAMRRIPGVSAHHWECTTDPALQGKRDLNVAVDWAEDALGREGFIEPRPLVYWMSDTHCNAEAREYRYKKAERADFVYCSIRGDVGRLAERGIKAAWLPYAAEPLVYCPHPEAERKYDVGFVGHVSDYPAREDFLDAMFRAFPNFLFDHGVYLEECSLALAGCGIVLNHCWVDGINMRVMEGMSNGSLLLTPQTADLAELGIEDGVHCATYRTTDEAIEKARHYLAHEDERKRVGEAGRALVLDRHTYIHRALRVLADAGHPVECDVKALIETYPTEWAATPQEPRIHRDIPI